MPDKLLELPDKLLLLSDVYGSLGVIFDLEP